MQVDNPCRWYEKFPHLETSNYRCFAELGVRVGCSLRDNARAAAGFSVSRA